MDGVPSMETGVRWLSGAQDDDKCCQGVVESLQTVGNAPRSG